MNNKYIELEKSIYEGFKNRKLYFEFIVKFIITIGLYLHVTSLFIGRELLKQNILTPQFDLFLLMLFILGALGLIIFYNRIEFSSRIENILYILLAFWILISIPIHLSGILGGNTNFIDGFPAWYSYFFIGLFLILYYNFSQIKIKNLD